MVNVVVHWTVFSTALTIKAHLLLRLIEIEQNGPFFTIDWYYNIDNSIAEASHNFGSHTTLCRSARPPLRNMCPTLPILSLSVHTFFISRLYRGGRGLLDGRVTR